MKPIDQRIISPENGDCFKCCIASLLELDYEDVPNFIEFGRGKWYEKTYYFLQEHGYDLHGLSQHQATKPTLEEYKGVDGFIIARGPSLRYEGSTHAVIYKKGELVHDPHPSKAGVPEVLGFYMIQKKLEEN